MKKLIYVLSLLMSFNAFALDEMLAKQLVASDWEIQGILSGAIRKYGDCNLFDEKSVTLWKCDDGDYCFKSDIYCPLSLNGETGVRHIAIKGRMINRSVELYRVSYSKKKAP